MKKMMISFMLALSVFIFPLHARTSFLYNVERLDKKQIKALSDDELADRYVDVAVEVEASKTFHRTSGFTKEGYNNYKELLRYRLLLSIEVQKRNLEIQKYIKTIQEYSDY